MEEDSRGSAEALGSEKKAASPAKIAATVCIAAVAVWVWLFAMNRPTPTDEALASEGAFPSLPVSIISGYESDATTAAGLSPADVVYTVATDGRSTLVTNITGGYSTGLLITEEETYAFFSSVDEALYKITGEIPEDSDLASIGRDMLGWYSPIETRGSKVIGTSDDGLAMVRFSLGDGTKGYAYMGDGAVKRMEVFPTYTDAEGTERTEHFMMMHTDPVDLSVPEEWTGGDLEEISGEEYSERLAVFLSVALLRTSEGLDAATVEGLFSYGEP